MNETTISAIRFALDIALKATLLFSFTSLAIGLLRRSGAAARHLAGTAGLIGALALPLLTLALPRWDIGVLPAPILSAGIEVSSSAVPLTERYDPAPGPRPEAAKANTMKIASPVTPPNSRGQSVPWPLLALAGWMAGALLVGARLAFGMLRVRRIGREAAPIRDREWTEETRRLSRELELDRPVELLESARVPVAMTSGVLRPLLLLCRQARLWEVERRRVVLLHELAHVRRGDWLWLLLAEAALAFYWWHPLAWALGRQVRRDCERACDDLVLAAGTKPSVYAGHLLGIFRSLSAAAHPVAPAVASARPSHFEGRLRAILDPGQPRREMPRGPALISATSLFAAAAVIAVVQPWTPVCANATIRNSSAETSAGTRPRPAVTDQAPVSACPQERAKNLARLAHVAPSASASMPSSASEDAAAPEEPMPDSGRALPAILKAIDVVKEAAGGFVRASNDGGGTGRRDGGDWYSRGMSLHHREHYDEAIKAFQKAIEAGYREDASSYNIAYARLDQKDVAFDWLFKALDAGFDATGTLRGDEDLDNLRGDPRFRKALRIAKAREKSDED